jgi:hypothetical protein
LFRQLHAVTEKVTTFPSRSTSAAIAEVMEDAAA